MISSAKRFCNEQLWISTIRRLPNMWGSRPITTTHFAVGFSEQNFIGREVTASLRGPNERRHAPSTQPALGSTVAGQELALMSKVWLARTRGSGPIASTIQLVGVGP